MARDLGKRLDSPPSSRPSRFRPSSSELVARGWIGAKAGQGFYKKTDDGEILTLDPSR